MNKSLIPAAVMAAGVLALAACGANVEHGTITAKAYDPPETSVYMQPVYGQRCVNTVVYSRTKYGTTRAQTSRRCYSVVTGHYPVYSHVAACYRLELKNSSGDTGSVCVSESAWNGAKVGGQW